MERRARCRICKELVTYTDPQTLGYHLIKKHPSFNPIYFTTSEDTYQKSREQCETYFTEPDYSIECNANSYPSSLQSCTFVSEDNQPEVEQLYMKHEHNTVTLNDSFHSASESFSIEESCPNKPLIKKIQSIIDGARQSTTFGNTRTPEEMPEIFEAKTVKKVVCDKRDPCPIKTKVCVKETCPNRKPKYPEPSGKCPSPEPSSKCPSKAPSRTNSIFSLLCKPGKSTELDGKICPDASCPTRQRIESARPSKYKPPV